MEAFPSLWRDFIDKQLSEPFDWDLLIDLNQKLKDQRLVGRVFPEDQDLFSALKLTTPDMVKVVILGQDPYHGFDEKVQLAQAHGLSFSVRKGLKFPPSLRNMFKEMESDLELPRPESGDLTPWAKQGVLLLNTVLSVSEGEAGSHKDWGWLELTQAIIKALGASDRPIMFVLWGGYAKGFAKLIDDSKHGIHMSAHPSPLSASRGFFGSKPYSRINAFLAERGQEEIDWSLDIPEEAMQQEMF